MEFTGLLKKYSIGRVLTPQEISHHLHPKKPVGLRGHDHLCVVRMNSTYLESVDKWFAWKGSLSIFMIALIVIFTTGFLRIAYLDFTVPRAQGDDFPLLIYIGGMSALAVGGATWMLCKDWFAYTHYPIRFNRMNRMVYVFRTNGTVLAAPWDEIFFTLENLPQMNDWEVRGHVLDKDGETVKETFALSYWGTMPSQDLQPGLNGPSENDFLRSHWEFIRRYMEEGPDKVIHHVQFCIPLDGRRETVHTSIVRTFANISSAPGILYWILFPFCAVVSIFRLGAMRTSKIPQWPEEIEAACKIKDGDPYAIAGDASGRRVAVYPEAAKAAGISFDPARCPTASKGGMQHNF